MQIIQIVPRLPPAIDGLGDYALNLARQFRTLFGLQTCFLVASPSWVGEAQIEGFPALQVSQRSPSALLNLLSSQASTDILLHYSGYGYAKRGCPTWLVESLQIWRNQHSSCRLVTMFHEVYATSNLPWTSSFWLSSRQKQLAAGLIKLSDQIFTSNQVMAHILTQLSLGQLSSVTTLPVFSNIGEPKSLTPLSQRKRQLIVFGHRNSRLQVYEQCQDALDRVCCDLDIERIYDIGVPTGLNLHSYGSIPVVEKGVADARGISDILSSSVAAFLKFPPPNFLAKSGVFAAYCAHGVIPCKVDHSFEPFDGLIGGKHYWVATDLSHSLNLHTAQEIAQNAYTWYQPHSVIAQAKIFVSAFGMALNQQEESR